MSMFDISERAQQLQKELLDFMESHVYPAEAVYEEQMRDSGDPHYQPPVLEELKAEARNAACGTSFTRTPSTGAGLTNLEYAPLAEIMGRSFIAPEACNCSAPDTGNMEVLELFGTTSTGRSTSQPLLEGTIRSAFAMTEPQVASSMPPMSSCPCSGTATTTCSTAGSGSPPTPCTRTARSSS